MVSVLTSRSEDVPTSRLGLISAGEATVSVSVLGSWRLGLDHLPLVLKVSSMHIANWSTQAMCIKSDTASLYI